MNVFYKKFNLKICLKDLKNSFILPYFYIKSIIKNTYVLNEKSAISIGKIIGVNKRIVHRNNRDERRYFNIFDSAAAALSKAKNIHVNKNLIYRFVQHLVRVHSKIASVDTLSPFSQNIFHIPLNVF